MMIHPCLTNLEEAAVRVNIGEGVEAGGGELLKGKINKVLYYTSTKDSMP